MRAIVGAQIGSKITNSVPFIIQAVENGTITRWLSRQEMALMAAFDLGSNWNHMASSQVLFYMDDDGKPHPVEERANS
jgi:hypothetical protein